MVPALAKEELPCQAGRVDDALAAEADEAEAREPTEDVDEVITTLLEIDCRFNTARQNTSQSNNVFVLTPSSLSALHSADNLLTLVVSRKGEGRAHQGHQSERASCDHDTRLGVQI